MVDEGLPEELQLIEALRADLAGGSRAQVDKLLRIVRTHLGMDVGFVSEFVDGRRVFRHVDNGAPSPVAVGGSDRLEESYCQRVIDGRLPQLIPNACENREALTLPATRALPVGAHLSVPIRLADGRLFGTFCCFSFTADRSLTDRDLRLLHTFAAITAELIEAGIAAQDERARKLERVTDVLTNRRIETRLQPIYTLADDTLAGFEALARFPVQPTRSPDVWFNEAAEVGLAPQLEFLAAKTAVRALADLPEPVTLSVNLSPSSVMTPEFAQECARLPLHRLVVEVTEHAPVESYDAFNAALAPWRARGLKLAVDDAGAGHSSLRHVLALRPDIIKLDMSLTRNVDSDPARHALATALTLFGRTVGAAITAEGVETPAELAALRAIGVAKVQGYLLGKPMPLAEALMLPVKARLPEGKAAA